MAERKPRLKPLEQWICDHCRQLIEAPDQGWIEWLMEQGGVPKKWRAKGFRIVHHRGYSPRMPDGHCDIYRDLQGSKQLSERQLVHDSHLEYYSGKKALPFLMSLVDPGPHYQPRFTGASVTNLREWGEILRRLTYPYYEEARFYLGEAVVEMDLRGLGEVDMYDPDLLKKVIRKYG